MLLLLLQFICLDNLDYCQFRLSQRPAQILPTTKNMDNEVITVEEPILDRALSPSSSSVSGRDICLIETALLMSVLEGRLGLSASILSPEQRKLLHTQMKTFISNSDVGTNYRRRDMPANHKIALGRNEGAITSTPKEDDKTILRKMFKNQARLEILFEMREMTKSISKMVSLFHRFLRIIDL